MTLTEAATTPMSAHAQPQICWSVWLELASAEIKEHIPDETDPIYRDFKTLQHNIESIEEKAMLSTARSPILEFNRRTFARNSHNLWKGLSSAYEKAVDEPRIRSEIASAHARLRTIQERLL